MKQVFIYTKSFLALVVGLGANITLLSSGVAQGQDSNLSQNEPLKSTDNTSSGGNESMFISIPVENGFVNRNIEAAEIDRKVVVEFKRMQGTFFHGSFRDASIDYFGHRCAMR